MNEIRKSDGKNFSLRWIIQKADVGATMFQEVGLNQSERNKGDGILLSTFPLVILLYQPCFFQVVHARPRKAKDGHRQEPWIPFSGYQSHLSPSLLLVLTLSS